MKNITLNLAAHIDGESAEKLAPELAALNEKIAAKARAGESASDEAQAYGKLVNEFTAEAETTVRSAAAALVAQLQASGVRITTATLAFSGAQGDHAQVEVVDLKGSTESRPTESAAATETASSGI